MSDRPPNRIVLSHVICWNGKVDRQLQVFPPSTDTKIGVVLPPNAYGTQHEAAISNELTELTVRSASAFVSVSPLRATGIMSTTVIEGPGPSLCAHSVPRNRIAQTAALSRRKDRPSASRVEFGLII